MWVAWNPLGDNNGKWRIDHLPLDRSIYVQTEICICGMHLTGITKYIQYRSLLSGTAAIVTIIAPSLKLLCYPELCKSHREEGFLPGALKTRRNTSAQGKLLSIVANPGSSPAWSGPACLRFLQLNIQTKAIQFTPTSRRCTRPSAPTRTLQADVAGLVPRKLLMIRPEVFVTIQRLCFRFEVEVLQ